MVLILTDIILVIVELTVFDGDSYEIEQVSRAIIAYFILEIFVRIFVKG